MKSVASPTTRARSDVRSNARTASAVEARGKRDPDEEEGGAAADEHEGDDDEHDDERALAEDARHGIPLAEM